MPEKCACVVRHPYKSPTCVWEPCPLHAAAEDLAQALSGLCGVMEAEGGGRWFKTKAAAYLARMQFNLREQAIKGRAALAKAGR